jgi:hypothetical protein
MELVGVRGAEHNLDGLGDLSVLLPSLAEGSVKRNESCDVESVD